MTDTLTEREGFKMVRGPAEVGDTLESAKAMLIDANLFCLRTHQKITPVGEGEIRKLIAIIGAAQDEIADYKRIRELLLKSLCRATGRSREAVEDGPLTCAVKHANEIAALREDAVRFEFLNERCLALDTEWGDRKETVLVFRWPTDARVGANLRAAIDSARKAKS